MRNFFLLLFFISLQSFAQNAFILLKDGSKIKADDHYLEVKESTLRYKLPGEEKEQRVKFKVLDYAVFGAAKFKSFGNDSYFVLAEENGKILASEVIKKEMNLDTFYKYTLIVFDANNKKIDDYSFSRWPSKGKAIDRAKAPDFIRKYFGDCQKVNDRLAEHKIQYDEFNLRICSFLDNPVFLDCNK